MAKSVVDLLVGVITGLTDEEFCELLTYVDDESKRRAPVKPLLEGPVKSSLPVVRAAVPVTSRHVWWMHVKGLRAAVPKSVFELDTDWTSERKAPDLPEGSLVLAGWTNGAGKHYRLMRVGGSDTVTFHPELAGGVKNVELPGMQMLATSDDGFQPIGEALSEALATRTSAEPSAPTEDWL